jgi:hypothetical protein
MQEMQQHQEISHYRVRGFRVLMEKYFWMELVPELEEQMGSASVMVICTLNKHGKLVAAK